MGCSPVERAAHCPGEPDLDLWQTSLTGEAGPLVRAPWADGFADWAPDGERLAFIASRDGNCEVYLTWSPDDLSFVHDREVGPGDVDIYVDGELLVDGPGVDTLRARSPDGSSIVFSSDRP